MSFAGSQTRPTDSDDLFTRRVPLHRTASPIRHNGHLACNGGPISNFERAVRLLPAADTIDEILHVRFGCESIRGPVRRTYFGRLYLLIALRSKLHAIPLVSGDRSPGAEQLILCFTVV